MATVTHVLSPLDINPAPRTGFAPLTVLDGGAADPHVPALLFDAAAREEAQFTLKAVDYGSGNLTVYPSYSMASGTTGSVVWAAQVRAYTPGDAQDLVTDAFAAANTVTSTVTTAAGFMKSTSIAVSNLDSLADGDYVTLRVYRDSTNAADTAAGDAELVQLHIEYSST